MLFNSIDFIIFFPIVAIIYFLLNYKWRWVFLLAASYYFYMCWKVEYIILIVASTLIDYTVGLQMKKAKTQKRKKFFLVISLLSNLGILFGFKYFNFFSDSLRALFNQFNIFYDVPYFNVLLPVGISFYTFQTLSYTIEVYRGNQKPEKHLGIFALYVSFFPQLVAGPIERSTNLLPQFYRKNQFSWSNLIEGFKLMLWGFFMKLVVADRVALYVNAVYNYPEEHSGLTFMIATVFFAFQIYCDFAGYSNIAIGAAKILGYDLMLNFNRPYFARSIKEFWARWHISLSTWFRDYLYIPLGGNRVSSTYRWYYNLFMVFLISGLWHGANWTFVIWGALHGFYLVFAIVTEKAREKIMNTLFKGKKLRDFMEIVITFILVNIAWVFFRANNVTEGFFIISKMFTFSGPVFIGQPSMFIYSVFSITVLLLIEIKEFSAPGNVALFSHQHWFIRQLAYISLVLMILLFGVFDGGQFIYFQF